MSAEPVQIVPTPSGIFRYPASHWKELSRFMEGDERDPRDAFRLADDIWETWVYAGKGDSLRKSRYRYRFVQLRSFLKPYVKWYVYQRLLGNAGSPTHNDKPLPYQLSIADAYLVEHDFISLDDIASPTVFHALWEAQIAPLEDGQAIRSNAQVNRQLKTRVFWLHLRSHFGVPAIVPPFAPHKYTHPTEIALDESKVIPLPVIKQLVNKLALHREGKERLNRYHHLRLCVLLLLLASGRRINEVLAAPRGSGENGPLSRYPARGGGPEGALWFQFNPSKRGPRDRVYASPKWETLVEYCTRELLHYSDEVRQYASPRERDLLILVSPLNLTAGTGAGTVKPGEDETDFAPADTQADASIPSPAQEQVFASPLYDDIFWDWLNGRNNGKQEIPGILAQWKITVDGLPNGEIYYLRPHYARHTRQTALASDSQTTALTRQRDLNHTSREMQLAYQHGLKLQHQKFLEPVCKGGDSR